MFWYYWPLPLLKYRKRPSMSAMLLLWCSFAPGLLFCAYLFNGMRCKPFSHFCLLADDKFRLSPLLTNWKIHIETDMGGKSVQSNCFKHFFFIVIYFSKWVKIWNDDETPFYKIDPVHISGPTTNQLNYRISQDISLH